MKTKINQKKLLISCLLTWATFFSYSQTVLIVGTVTNVQGAVLSSTSIVAKQNTIIKAFAQSSINGRFSITLPSNEIFLLQITSVGYITYTETINTTNSIADKKYILQIQITQQDTIRIESKRGVYESGDTIIYNTDVYKKNNENNLKDLLNNMPGIRVMSNGKIIADNQLVDKILIDGKDLTGENYEKIVNNLSPHGLDQIQILKKYKDPFNLTSTATGNTEVALNLTFKNKKIIPSAKVSLSFGIPIAYYEQKSDFLVLTKPITALNFININTVGNTYQQITSPNSLFGNINTEVFNKLGKN